MKHKKTVFSLDIETSKTDFSCPEKSTLAFVGLQCYFYKGKKLYSGYKHYAPTELHKLRELLIDIPCVIVGHNILGFDYRVLNSHMDLHGIIEKSVDTLFFLKGQTGGVINGLSLKSLSIWNDLGLKGFDVDPWTTYSPWEKGESVSKVWNRGERRKVYKYNKKDCELTYNLWSKILDSGEIRWQQFGKFGERMRTLFISKKERTLISGHRKVFTYDSWNKHFSDKASRALIKPEVAKLLPVERCLRCGATESSHTVINPKLNTNDFGDSYYDLSSEGFCRCGKCKNQFYFNFTYNISDGVFPSDTSFIKKLELSPIKYSILPFDACPICKNKEIRLLPHLEVFARRDKDRWEDYSEKTHGITLCKKCKVFNEYHLYFGISRIDKQSVKIPDVYSKSFVVAPKELVVSGKCGSFYPIVSEEHIARGTNRRTMLMKATVSK